MNIIADTNILVRVILQDDGAQTHLAAEYLRRADNIAIATTTLCELVWILQKNTKLPREEIVRTIQTILDTDKMIVNRACVEAGLAVLAAGGDFADGVVEFEGKSLNDGLFCTFDRKAANILSKQGYQIEWLSVSGSLKKTTN